MMVRTKALAGATCLLMAALPTPSVAQDSSAWQFQASVYGYLPTISGSTTFPAAGGGSGATVDVGQILDNLKFTFMGTFEAQKGKLGFFTDVIYLDVGDDKTASRALQIGNTQLPAGATADVGLDLKSWVWTLGGSYRTVSDSDLTLDVFGGTRLLDAQQKLNWTVAGNVGQIALPDRTGNREAKVQNWDVIAGVKGRARFGQSGRWFAPFYFDIGTGESDVTLQAMAGVGYTFGWGDVVGAWRYLDYNMKSSSPIADLSFNGPLIAAVFRW